MEFNLKSLPDSQTDKQFKSRIEPGVHDVVIKDFFEDVNQNGNRFIGITVDNLEGTRTHTERMFITTPKGVEWTTRRIRDIFRAIYDSSKELDGLSVERLKKAFVGQKLRILFIGRETVDNKNGGTRWNAEMRLSNFAENIGVKESRLTFDPVKHMYPLASVPPATKPDVTPVVDGDSDLPFDEKPSGQSFSF